MTLDEAIICEEKASERCKEIGFAINSKYNSDTERGKKYYTYAEEHRQIAEWLKELKHYKDCQDLINKSWQELINYKEGIEKIKMRSQAYRERGETVLASGMEQALNILKEVNANTDSN